MKAASDELDRALDYTPVLAWLNSPNSTWMLRAFSACWAGGLRTFALPMEIPHVASLIETMTARADVLVGCTGVRRAEDIAPAADAGASFLVTTHVDAEFARQIPENAMVWIPEVDSEGDLVLAAELGATVIHLSSAEKKGGPAFVRELTHTYPTLSPLVSGVLGRDVVSYIDAGARAVALTGALYTSAMLEAGQQMTIRHQAAMIAKEATRHSVMAREQMKRG